MIEVKQLISEVRVGLGENNADSNRSDRFLWGIIDKHMRWLIRRESNKMKLMHYQDIFQTIKCLKVEEAPVIDPCCGIKTRCTVYRTCEKLPELYEDDEGVILKSVFSIDGSQDFQPITINEYMRKLEDPNSKYDKSLYYFFNNGYLYFPRNKPKMIMVKGLFTADVFNNCDDDPIPCRSRQDNTIWFPEALRGELMEHVMKDLFPTKQIPIDEQIDKDETRKN